MNLRVLLADDEPLVRRGLRSVVASEPGFAVADYLLKPFDADHIRLSLARARARFATAPTHDVVAAGKSARATPIDHLLLKQAGRVRVVPLDTVRWIEADGNYVRVHSTMGVFRRRNRLGDVSARLEPQRFEQIHRSAIANLKYVPGLVPLSSGDSDVILDTGERLTLSRTFWDLLRTGLARQFTVARPGGPQFIPPALDADDPGHSMDG